MEKIIKTSLWSELKKHIILKKRKNQYKHQKEETVLKICKNECDGQNNWQKIKVVLKKFRISSEQL